MSGTDIQFYRDHGYLIVPRLVSPAAVDQLRADRVRVCRGHYPHEELQPMAADLSDDEVLRNFLCIHQPHKISPVMGDVGCSTISDPYAWKGIEDRGGVSLRACKALEDQRAGRA